MAFRITALALMLCAPALFPGAAAPLHAQESTSIAQRMALATATEQRALLMMRYDQAAWHATDSLLASLGSQDMSVIEERFPGTRGYIVVPTDQPDVLEALWVAERDNRLTAIASYRVRGDDVLEGRIFTADQLKRLTPVEERMYRAREILINAANENNAFLCTQAMNTLVLPPDANGMIDAYLMSATTSSNLWPMGGHFRVTIAPDGTTSDWRPFTNGCIDAQWGPQDGITPTMYVISHMLDEQPTEIHLFASYHMPIALGVMAGDQLWLIENGRVAPPEDLPKMDD